MTLSGSYAQKRIAIIRRGLHMQRNAVLAAQKSIARSLEDAYQHWPHSGYYELDDHRMRRAREGETAC
jgi:hypothetical protein